MEELIRLVGPQSAVELLGVRLVGLNAENGKKLLVTIIFILLALLLRRALRALSHRLLERRGRERIGFWSRQGVNLAIAGVLVLGVVSIWFDDPTRLTTVMGLITAGLAFALQKVVTAIAGYFVILRGRTFNVGDRIVMGGVRGDVLGLDFTQTTIMEMGQPASVQGADPAMWVRSREYTGRIVTISNARIFDEPVYNYTREFPYIWEELKFPLTYGCDRARAERILLDAAERHSVSITELGREALEELQRRYAIDLGQITPKVYYSLTDAWLELTVRFIVEDHGIRTVKDAMSRDILRDLDDAGIGIASTTLEIVGLPPVRVQGFDRAAGSS